MYDPLKRPPIKRPRMTIPWGFVSLVMTAVVVLAIFGSWSYVAWA